MTEHPPHIVNLGQSARLVLIIWLTRDLLAAIAQNTSWTGTLHMLVPALLLTGLLYSLGLNLEHAIDRRRSWEREQDIDRRWLR